MNRFAVLVFCLMCLVFFVASLTRSDVSGRSVSRSLLPSRVAR